MKNERIIYSINVDDVQNVATETIDRELTEEEINLVEEKIGNYIAWYDILDMIITDTFSNTSASSK